MLILGVFTTLPVGLLTALVALAAPDDPASQPDEALELSVPPEEGDAPSPGGEFTDEDDDIDDRRKEWRCWDDDEREKRGYCLARCDGDDFYRVLTNKIRVRGNADFCRRIARKSCKRRGDSLDHWCFGSREAAKVAPGH